MLKLEAELLWELMPNRPSHHELSADLSLLCVTVRAHKSVLFRLLLYTDPAMH